MKYLVLLFLMAPDLFSNSPTYLFLRSDISARAAALGGSFVSAKNDPNGIFYNPSLISTIDKEKFSFGYSSYLTDLKTTHFSFNKNYDSLNDFGLGIIYNSYGDFIEKDEFNNELGIFSASDLVLITSYSYKLEENLFVGVSSKFINSTIANYKSSAIAVDCGIYYFLPGSNPLTFGASIQNFGKQIKSYNTTKEDLPFDIKIGMTIKPEHLPMDINLNFNKINEDQKNDLDRLRYFSIGGEFTMSASLKFRFGYNNEKRKDLKLGTSSDMAGFSFGFGFAKETYIIDYAYSSLGKIGEVNRINLSLIF